MKPTKYPEHEIELRGGRWVNRGMIKVWVQGATTKTPPQPRPRRRAKAETHVKVTSGPNLCDCGCLLLTVGENCPCCRFWAYENERKTRTYTY